MAPRLSGHCSLFGVLIFVFRSLLEIARQWSREEFAILTLNPRSHVRVLIYRTWAIRAFKCSVPTEPPQPYKNLDA